MGKEKTPKTWGYRIKRSAKWSLAAGLLLGTYAAYNAFVDPEASNFVEKIPYLDSISPIIKEKAKEIAAKYVIAKAAMNAITTTLLTTTAGTVIVGGIIGAFTPAVRESNKASKLNKDNKYAAQLEKANKEVDDTQEIVNDLVAELADAKEELAAKKKTRDDIKTKYDKQKENSKKLEAKPA